VERRRLQAGSLREAGERRLVSPEGIVPEDASAARGRAHDDILANQRNEVELVTLTFASWNQVAGWLRRMEGSDRLLENGGLKRTAPDIRIRSGQSEQGRRGAEVVRVSSVEWETGRDSRRRDQEIDCASAACLAS
jgi:hypothetical protein